MKITNLCTNHLQNPLGYWMDDVTFNWTVEDTPSTDVSFARVVVATDDSFANVCYDSGECPKMSGIAHRAVFTLSPCTRYYWKVWVKGNRGDDTYSKIAWFETGKMEQPWQAPWIRSPFDGAIHPVFHHNFTLNGTVESARAYVCGLGLYELYCNGQKVGDEVLAPFCNSYDNWVQYQTYDLSELLQHGNNALGALLGNGWYKGEFGFKGGGVNIYGDSFLLRLELLVRYTNGTQQLITTGPDWLCAASPITASGIYLGEHYDAQKETTAFASSNCDTSAFVPAEIVQMPALHLQARRSAPLRVIERIKPIALLHTPAGEQVLDFGQLLTGWVECHLDLPAGEVFRLQHGELLQHGNFYTENLRTAKQEYCFTSSGVPANVRPHFTFYGFRFVKIEGITVVNPDDFTACVIHSDLAFTGNLTISNPKVQKLVQNALWGQRGNFLDVPTDCPQRDERMGWTGDAQVFAPTACFNMESAAFFDKYLYDAHQEQQHCNGAVPHVVPDFLRHLEWDLDFNEEGFAAGSCGWGDVITVIPWTLYQFYGDTALLARHYPAMQDWVAYIQRHDQSNGDTGLWRTGFHFADWLALDNPDKQSLFGRTNSAFVASCYYYYSTLLTGKSAAVLGYTTNAETYHTLARKVRTAIQAEFFTADGQLTIDTQTAHVLALFFDIVPAEHRQKTVEGLSNLLHNNNDHLDTGFIGTAYLCKVLSNNGLNQLAYTLLLNEDFPSWLYEVNMGATTVWERWNSVLPNGTVSGTGMNSMNHYAYGAIVEWMYTYMCGLQPTTAGFSTARIAPMPDPRIQSAVASYQSAAGQWQSGWQFTKDGCKFTVTVPFGAVAHFCLPCEVTSALYCGHNLPVDTPLVLQSGTHTIFAKWTT